MEEKSALGMYVPIARRSFIGGVAVSAAAATFGTSVDASVGPHSPPVVSPDYPPLRTGLRGQHPGSFETAHLARDGEFGAALDADETGEHYDLIVVGGGISGLSAAYFYRAALGPNCKILILDNHDDFGGHAKRNEFRHDGKIYLSYGGTESIETPFPYSFISLSLLSDLGINPNDYPRFVKSEDNLGRGVFFDRENFMADRIVSGVGSRPWADFFSAAPLKQAVRDELVRLHTERRDFLPALDPLAKADALRKMSYRDFLADHARLSADSLPFFAGMAFRNNMRMDTCPAYSAMRSGAPGFDGMVIAQEPKSEATFFHFPDGNASIARLLVARLIPGVFPDGMNAERIVLAPASYARLDRPESPVRIRLSSTAIRVQHLVKPSDRASEEAVRIVYARDGKKFAATAGNLILACFNSIIPYIVEGLPDQQQEALRYASKVPMQYTNVLVRNWKPWKKLGVRSIEAPNGYHTSIHLDTPLDMGGYRSVEAPDEPVVVQMVRNPNSPGLPRREQHRVGRAEMLTTAFETIEHEVRSQLQRMLGPAGFDARRDILALTVNRWPHGYAYTYDTLGDPEMPDAERPHVIGRRPFGRIAIANADAGASAFTNVAIDQAERAVRECLISRGLN